MPSYTLKSPIVLKDNRQFAVLTMEGATLAGVAMHESVLASTGSSTAALVAMLAVECGWPQEAVGRIAAAEMEAVIEALDPFAFARQPGESGEPSPQTSPTS